MPDLFSQAAIAALAQVILIDLVLAGDNAVVIGLAAAGLPVAATPARHPSRHRGGDGDAHRIRLSSRSNCSRSSGLLLAGGILLLWVCWKMWRELRARPRADARTHRSMRRRRGPAAQDLRASRLADRPGRRVDVARQRARGGGRRARASGRAGVRPGLSIVLMGFAANFIARLLHKHRWIAYVGLAIVLYVALDMIWRGSWEIAQRT